jgi:hypothetical protein
VAFEAAASQTRTTARNAPAQAAHARLPEAAALPPMAVRSAVAVPPPPPSAPPKPSETVVEGTFALASELAGWLATHGVDTSSWGVGKAKDCSSLKSEIDQKECTLELVEGQVPTRTHRATRRPV